MIDSTITIEEILASIRSASKRVTAAKQTVAEVLVAARGHLTADEITSEVQRRRCEVSPSTIYRILEEFEDLEIVVHSHLGQPAAVYHLAGGVHGHLSCERCGRTFQISASHFDSLSDDLRNTYGFELDRHHLAVTGLCEQCQPPRTKRNLGARRSY